MRSASVRTRDPIEPSLSLARFGSLLAASFSRAAMASSSRNEVSPRTAFPTIDRAFVTPDSWKRMTRSVDFVIFVVEQSISRKTKRRPRSDPSHRCFRISRRRSLHDSVYRWNESSRTRNRRKKGAAWRGQTVHRAREAAKRFRKIHSVKEYTGFQRGGTQWRVVRKAVGR